MGTTKKLVLGALAAMMLLALATGTAMALRSLSSSSRTISLLARGLVLGAAEFEGVKVICDVGSTVTLNSNPIAKSARSRIALVLYRILSCSEQRAIVLGGPFEVNYLGFTGTLPEIRGLELQVLRVTFLVEIPSLLVRCLYTMNVLERQEIRQPGGVLGNLSGRPFRLESISIRNLGGLFCPSSPTLEGTFSPTGSTTITLV